MDALFGTGEKRVSQREYDIIEDRNVYIPMRDGVRINVDVFRPDGKGRYPALLAISAFSKEIQSRRIWPAASRSRRINGTPDAAIEAGPTDFFCPPRLCSYYWQCTRYREFGWSFSICFTSRNSRCL